tara:strand:- start:448 stop:1038 length:591 start_codon:yes stop_codon:yes gene_type:complete
MKYISFGKQCSVANALKDNHIRTESYPWDWMYIGHFDDMITMLETRNHVLFDRDNWIQSEDEPTKYINTKLINTSSRHFFDETMSNFDQVVEKLKHRTYRFFQLLSSSSHLILIRDEQWYKLDPNLYNKSLLRFKEIMKTFNSTWELRVIIDSCNTENTKKKLETIENIRFIYVHSNGETSWERNVVPWKYILFGF